MRSFGNTAKASTKSSKSWADARNFHYRAWMSREAARDGHGAPGAYQRTIRCQSTHWALAEGIVRCRPLRPVARPVACRELPRPYWLDAAGTPSRTGTECVLGGIS